MEIKASWSSVLSKVGNVLLPVGLLVFLVLPTSHTQQAVAQEESTYSYNEGNYYAQATYNQYLQALYAGYLQSVYGGYGQSTYATYDQSVYTGYTQDLYAGYTQSAYPPYTQGSYGPPYTQSTYPSYTQSTYPSYAQSTYIGYFQVTYSGYAQDLYAGYTQNIYAGYSQAVYPPYLEATYPPYTQGPYIGYGQTLYAGYTQNLYAGYTQGIYPTYTQATYGPGYGQASYGNPYTQALYAGYAQGLYLGYSQAVYPPYTQTTYAPTQTTYLPTQTTYAPTQTTYSPTQTTYAPTQTTYGYTESTYGYTESAYIGSRPTIQITPQSLTFNANSFGATPPGKSVTIRNTGNATLRWTASAPPGKPGTWCQVSPTSGTVTANSSQTVVVTVSSPSNVGTFTDCGIRIADPNATNNPQDIAVTYAVTTSGYTESTYPYTESTYGYTESAYIGSRPTIQITPQSLTFNANSFGATPPGKSVTIRNTGNATLRWTASAPPGKPGTWCQVSPTSGTVTANSSQTVVVTVSSPSNVGTFTDCGIRIADPNATNNPQDIAVTYAVTTSGYTESTYPYTESTYGYTESAYIGSRPTIQITPQSLTFNANSFGATPPGKSVTIRNTGNATLRWTASAPPGKPGTWCQVSPTSGTVTANSSQTVVVTVSSPSNVGTFTDCGIRIADPNATNNPQDIAVTYAVTTSGYTESTYPYTESTYAYTESAYTYTQAVYGPGYTQAVYGPGYTQAVYSITPSAPTTVRAFNSSTDPLAIGAGPGSGPSRAICGQVRVTWTDVSSNEDGFRIYKSGVLVGTVGANVTTFTLTLGADTTPYTYTVSAFTATGESSQVPATDGAVAAVACTASLDASDKDIAGVGNSTFTIGTCNGFQAPPSSASFKNGNVVTFEIHLCNSSPDEAAKNISVVDYLSNLSVPTGGWQAEFQDPTTSAWTAITPSLSGTAPSQTLTFNFPSYFVVPKAPAVGSKSVRTLRFKAKITAPAGAAGSYGRFQNKADISYDAAPGDRRTKRVETPLIPYSLGGTLPNRVEVAP